MRVIGGVLCYLGSRSDFRSAGCVPAVETVTFSCRNRQSAYSIARKNVTGGFAERNGAEILLHHGIAKFRRPIPGICANMERRLDTGRLVFKYDIVKPAIHLALGSRPDDVHAFYGFVA